MKLTTMLATMLTVSATSFAQEAAPLPKAQLDAIAYLAGNFAVDNTLSMPDGAKTKSAGTATSKWTLKGRYLEMRIAGAMPPYGDYEGLLMLTYNEMTNQYDGTWFDSMGGQSLRASGSIVDGTLTMVTPPSTATLPQFRLVYRKIDDKSFDFKLDMRMGEGDWATQIASVYRRK